MSKQVREQKVVIFKVGHEEYAVPIQVVKEVGPWTRPTPIPEAPPIVDGVINLRGDVIPVVDLGRRFAVKRSKADADSRIIVMEVQGRQAGFVVDEVTEVHPMDEERFAPPSPLIRQQESDPMVTGILKIGEERLVVMVDPSKILTEQILAVV